MLCPACFQQKLDSDVCPACDFEETSDRAARFLAYRSELNGGRYIVGQVLGTPGGFGTAYKALDTEKGALVVIKECMLIESNQVWREPGNPEVKVNPGFTAEYDKWLGRFREEARHISRFGSPYIVRVTEVFGQHNTVYYVMPFVEGEHLGVYCAREGGSLGEAEVTTLALNLLSALAEMHKQKVVHRDIKPTNILINSATHKPVLIDFGAARDHFDDDRSRSHMAVHTPHYAPIEQVLVLRNQGPWTDIYSLCATLYFCLTGEPPPAAKERQSPKNGEDDPFVPIHQRLPDLNSSLAMVIDNGLALQARNRLQDAATAIRLLDSSTRPPGEADADAPGTEPPKDAGPQPTATPVRQPAGLGLMGLLPAASVLGYGAANAPDFAGYLNGLPGVIALANMAVWSLWLIGRRREAANAALAARIEPSASTGLGPTVLDQDAGEEIGIELSLVNEGFEPIVEFVPRGTTVVVGRNPKVANISVRNDMVSGRHVEIRVDDDGSFTLENLKATNGTFVYDRKADGGAGAWMPITVADGRKGRFMLGPPDNGGVLLKIRQAARTLP